MRIFCVSMTVPVESRLTMRKSRNGLLRSPHGDRIGHRNPLSYKPPESLRSERLAALRSEEHTSELQSLMRISYAVFCLKKKTTERIIIKSKTTNNKYVTQILHSIINNT